MSCSPYILTDMTESSLAGCLMTCPSFYISGDDWLRPIQIIKPEKYTVTEKCVYRENWQMVVCEDNYGKVIYEPRCEKTGLRGFRPGPTQTGLYSYR